MIALIVLVSFHFVIVYYAKALKGVLFMGIDWNKVAGVATNVLKDIGESSCRSSANSMDRISRRRDLSDEQREKARQQRDMYREYADRFKNM